MITYTIYMRLQEVKFTIDNYIATSFMYFLYDLIILFKKMIIPRLSDY